MIFPKNETSSDLIHLQLSINESYPGPTPSRHNSVHHEYTYAYHENTWNFGSVVLTNNHTWKEETTKSFKPLSEIPATNESEVVIHYHFVSHIHYHLHNVSAFENTDAYYEYKRQAALETEPVYPVFVPPVVLPSGVNFTGQANIVSGSHNLTKLPGPVPTAYVYTYTVLE